MLPDVTYILGDEVLVEPHPGLRGDLDEIDLPEQSLVETFWGLVTGETLVAHAGSLGLSLRDAVADPPLGADGDLVLTDQRLLVVDKLAAAPVVTWECERRHVAAAKVTSGIGFAGRVVILFVDNSGIALLLGIIRRSAAQQLAAELLKTARNAEM
jgi:hypothetical protein